MTRTPRSGPRKRPWWQHLLIFLSTLVVVAALASRFHGLWVLAAF